MTTKTKTRIPRFKTLMAAVEKELDREDFLGFQIDSDQKVSSPEFELNIQIGKTDVGVCFDVFCDTEKENSLLDFYGFQHVERTTIQMKSMEINSRYIYIDGADKIGFSYTEEEADQIFNLILNYVEV